MKDKKAFEDLFKEYYPFLCSFAKKYVDDVDACKDIVHNVFLNLWQKQETLQTESSLKPYLFKSVQNRCLNYIRDRKKIVRHDVIMEEEHLAGYFESTDYLEQSEMEMEIKATIDGLPDSCRQVFKLSRFEEKKYKEIADELEMPAFMKISLLIFISYPLSIFILFFFNVLIT